MSVLLSAGSTRASVNSSSEFGLRSFANSAPPAGSGFVNSGLYTRTSASSECAADAQWIVAFTLRPSGALPPRTAGDEIGVTQPALRARREPEELLRRVLHEIVALDIELAAEIDLSRAGCRIVRMVYGLPVFAIPARI